MKLLTTLSFITLSLFFCLSSKGATIVVNGISYTTLAEPSSGNPGKCGVDVSNQSCIMTDIVIPYSIFDGSKEYVVTEISARAFYENKNIITVDLSQCTDMTHIRQGAFQGCTSLKKVNLSGCSSLTMLSNYSFSSCSQLESVDLSGCTLLNTVADHSFYNCSSLRTIDLTVSEELYQIGSECFSGCTSLQSIFISGKLKYLDGKIFDSCSSLKTVVLYETNPAGIEIPSTDPFFTDPSIVHAILYVPAEAVETYKNIPAWRDSFVDILPIDELPGQEIPIESIELNLTDFSISLGASPVILRATINPDNATDSALSWNVEPMGYVEIIENDSQSVTITPLIAGTCVVTVTPKSYDNISANCNIVVDEIKDITIGAVSGVTSGNPEDGLAENTTDGGSLLGDDLVIRVGQTATLSATLDPISDFSPEVTWSIADASVASLQVNEQSIDEASFIGLNIGVTEYKVTAASASISGNIIVIAENPINSLRISPLSVSIPLNSLPFTLEAEILPATPTIADLNWESDNIAIATVDANGNITPMGIGECIVTATTKDGTGISAFCSVHVTSPVAESLEFDIEESMLDGAESLSLEVGETYQFMVRPGEPGSVLPDELTWESSDDSVVTVDEDGNVTAIGEGNAVITVTAVVNGQTITASCSIIIVPVSVKFIALSHNTSEITEGQTFLLIADCQPLEAQPQLKWVSSDENIIKVEPGQDETRAIVTALKPGIATVSVESANSKGLSDKCEFIVLEDKKTEISSLSEELNENIDIYDLNGRLVLRNVSAGSLNQSILKPGIYIIREGDISRKVRIN